MIRFRTLGMNWHIMPSSISSMRERGVSIRLMLIVILAWTLTRPVAAEWQVGLASVDITPDKPVLMSGYGGRPDPHKSVNSRLYAKALAIEDQSEYPDAIAMFMAGCGGDANPYPRGSLELAVEHGRTLGREVCRLLEAKLTPVTCSLKTEFEYVELPLAPQPSKETLEAYAAGQVRQSWERWSAAKTLNMMQQGQAVPTHWRAPIALWQFGGKLTLVALPGEPVADYVPAIAEALGPMNLWVAGYCNEVVGYLPTEKTLQEGGYEARGIDTGPGVGHFAPGVEQMVVDSVKALATRARRP